MVPSRGPNLNLSNDKVTTMTSMLQQVTLGSAVSLVNIAIHALVMIVILRCREGIKEILPSLRPALSLVGVMVAIVSILMAGHLSQIVVWSITYALVGAASSGTDYLYFAFVNYTTLGYGDVVPARHWLLLGPMTAMNGVLLFGWSTAVIFHVLTIELRAHPLWPDRHGSSDRIGGQEWHSDRAVC
jgi:hypothetical protein